MVRVVFGQVAQSLATISRQPRMPRPGRPGNDVTFEAVRSSIGGAGIVALLIVVAYCHGLAHACKALQVERPEGTADALAY